MMILVGTRDSNVKNGIISNEKCPKCKTENSLHFSIYKKYVHLTLIPLFPVGKSVFINCNHCDGNFDYEDLNENCQQKLANEKLSNSLWLFSGSFIIILFLFFTISSFLSDNDETKLLIKKPIIGDVYNLKFSSGHYSTLKINKITTDSVYTTHNDFYVYLPYELDDLDKAENYSNRKVSYSKKDLKQLYNNDEIIKIKRNKFPVEPQELEYKIPVTK